MRTWAWKSTFGLFALAAAGLAGFRLADSRKPADVVVAAGTKTDMREGARARMTPKQRQQAEVYAQAGRLAGLGDAHIESDVTYYLGADIKNKDGKTLSYGDKLSLRASLNALGRLDPTENEKTIMENWYKASREIDWIEGNMH